MTNDPGQPHGPWKRRLFANLHQVVLAVSMAIGSIVLAWLFPASASWRFVMVCLKSA